jgi:hypothetical protein
MEFELSRGFLVRQFRFVMLGFPEPDLQHSYGGRVMQASGSASQTSGSEPDIKYRLTNLAVTQVLHIGHCSGSSGVTPTAATEGDGAAAAGWSAANCSHTAHCDESFAGLAEARAPASDSENRAASASSAGRCRLDGPCNETSRLRSRSRPVACLRSVRPTCSEPDTRPPTRRADTVPAHARSSELARAGSATTHTLPPSSTAA